MCPRRLRFEHDGVGKTQGKFTHSRIRDPLVEDARAAHREMGPPNRESFAPRPDLLPEENALLQQAQRGYVGLFGDEPAQAIDHAALPSPYPAPRRKVTIGGYLDLVVETPAGKEVRQFELWGNELSADPNASWPMLCIALRLTEWADGAPLRLRHADLFSGACDEYMLDTANETPALAARFDRRLARLRARAANPVAEPSDACGTCPYIPQCEAHW